MIVWPHVAHFADLPDLRPALRARFQSIHAVIGDVFHVGMLEQLYRDFQSELSRTPELAELGFDLLRPGRTDEERRWGAVWLTLFPSLRMVEAMAALLRDPTQPLPLRNQAAWTLGFRQVQERHPALHWSAEVVAAANAELVHAYATLGPGVLERLDRALLHVDDPALDALFLADPLRAASVIDCFASPALARALLAQLPALRPEDAPRLMRLIGGVLGEEAAEPLLAFARGAPLALRYEAIFAALGAAPHRAQGAFEALVKSLQFPVLVEARGRWHLEHPGEAPTVTGSRFARTSALVAPAERSALAARACEGFEAMAPIDALLWPSLWDFWHHAAYLVHDSPARVVACVEARPDTLRQATFLLRPYLDALAREGRLSKLEQVAASHGLADDAAWSLAQSGRPFRALAMLERVRRPTSSSAAAEAMALFLGGRPDLAQQSLETRTSHLASSPSEPFPSADERWLAEHDATQAHLTPLIARDLGSLLGLMTPAPEGTEPDVIDLELIARCEATLVRGVAGRLTCLLGRFDDRAAVVERLEALGAQVVDGPFARSERVVVGVMEERDRVRLASLQNLGAVAIPVSEILAAPLA